MILYLKDGSSFVFHGDADANWERLIEEQLGYDVAQEFRAYTRELREYGGEKIYGLDCELKSYESSLEEKQNALLEIGEICDELTGRFMLETGRNRVAVLAPWHKCIQDINQIVEENT